MRDLKKILPKYAILPLAALLIMAAITYYGTRLITVGMVHYDIALPLDDWIPYRPEWIVVYVLTYVYWILCFYAILRDSKRLCYRLYSAEILGKVVCALCFLLLPCTLTRATPGDGFFDSIVRWIYAADRPDNLLPSIHVFNSWLCARGVLKCGRVPLPAKVAAAIFAPLICASTVLVKQHVVLDVVAGVVLAEACLWIAKRLRTERIFEKIEPRWVKE